MHSPNIKKNYASIINFNYKKSKRIISIFVVILLLTTAFSTIIATADDSKKTLKEKINVFKQKTENFVDKVSDKIQSHRTNKITERFNSRSSTSSISRTLSMISLAESDSTFSLFTNYNGIEKTSNLQFFKSTKVDVDGDGDDDIDAKLTILPGFELPFSLSINIGLNIKRLSGFANNKAFFEAFLELNLPGILIKEQEGDRVRFGYQSPDGKEVPPSCIVTYKFIPHLLSRDKPEHKVVLQTGLGTGSDDLSIIYSKAEMNGESVLSQDIFIVSFSPAVKRTVISAGRNKNNVGVTFSVDNGNDKSVVDIHYTSESEGNVSDVGLLIDKCSGFEFSIKLTPLTFRSSKVEYIRLGDSNVDVTLYKPNSDDSSTCAYVEGLPSHITLEWQPRLLNGYIDFNADGERVKSAGLRNHLDADKASAFVYVADMPSETRLDWSGSVFTQKTISLTCDAAGSSLYVYSTDFLNKGVLFDASLKSNLNLDLKVSWDLSTHTITIDRTDYDLELSVYVEGENGGVFDFYGEVKNTMTNPFIVDFGAFLDSDIDFTLSGRNLEINNLDAFLSIPGKGDYSVSWIQMKISNQGSIHIILTSSENDGKTTLCWDITINNGIILDGLTVGVSGKVKSFDKIQETGYATHDGCITFEAGTNVKWYIADDFSEGYFCVTGGLTLTFNSRKERPPGSLIGYAHGTVSFDTVTDELNVSWITVNGKLQLDIDGEGVASISDFAIWVKDKFRVSLPLLVGNFRGSVYDRSGELELLVEDGSGSFNINDFNIDVEDLLNITFKGSLTVNVQSNFDGAIMVSWDETGITSIAGSGGVYVNGDITISNLYFKYYTSSSITEMSASSIVFDGVIDVDFVLDDGHFEVNTDNLALDINTLDFMADKDTTDPTTVTANGIHISADGKIVIDDKTITLDADAGVDLVDCHAVIPGKADLWVTFYADLSGSGVVTILADKDNEKLEISVSSGSGNAVISDLDFSMNDGDTVVKCKEFRVRVPSGSGSVSLIGKGIQTLDIDASVSSLTLDGLSFVLPTKNFTISGSFSLGAAGRLILKASSVSDPKFIEAELISGSATISNVVINLNEGELKAEWVSLIIEGSLTANIESSENLEGNTEFNIDIDGEGKITLNTATINGEIENSEGIGTYDVEIGFFELDLDDVTGSIIGLTLGDNLGLNSANANGAITDITINDLSARFDEVLVNIPGLAEVFINITDLQMDFEGSGDFTFKLTGPDSQGIQQLSLVGNLPGNGEINIYYADLFLTGIIYVNLQDFSISGPTTFHMNAEGKLNLPGASLAEKLQYLSFSVGCDSQWEADHIVIFGMIGFKDFNCLGDISIGTDIIDINELEGDFVVYLDGDMSWVDLMILPMDLYNPDPGIGKGDFNGDITLYIDLEIFLALFADDIINALPDDGRVKITTNELSHVNLIEIMPVINIISADLDPGSFEIKYDISSGLNVWLISTMHIYAQVSNFAIGKTNWEINLAEIDINAGDFSISAQGESDFTHGKVTMQGSGTMNPTFNIIKLKNTQTGKSIDLLSISASFTYLEIGWDIDAISGSPDYEGYIAIDTNNEVCTIDVILFNLINLGGPFSAEDWNCTWEFDGNIFTWPFNPSGSITPGAGCTLELNMGGTWYTFPLDIGNQAPIADFTWSPNHPDVGQTITFDASASYDPDGNLNLGQIRWDFGEGDNDENDWTYWHLFTNWKIVDHTYADSGPKTIRCQVKDGLGKTSTIVSDSLFVGENSIPILYDHTLSPPSGYSYDEFTYTIKYQDDDDEPPTKMELYIDGAFHDDMEMVWSQSGAYYRAKYKCVTTLPIGDHTYYFMTSDGHDEVRDPVSGSYSGPTVYDNRSPIISSHYVTPETGTTNTLFTYKATYSDPENDPVDLHYVYIDGGSAIEMDYVSTYASGSILYHKYEYETTLSAGTHSFYYEFSDGVNPPVTTDVENNPTVTSGNEPPSLNIRAYSPNSGDTSTVFTFRVTYTDVDGDAPTVKKIYIDDANENGNGHIMTYAGGSYSSGATYEYETTLSEGSHVYHYRFDDGNGHSVRAPETVEAPGPDVDPPNTPPVLDYANVDPNSGTTSTQFTYEIRYTDVDNDAPITHKVYIDGIGFTMTKTSGDYTNGAWYEYTTTLSEGTHNYYFIFNDGEHADVRNPSSGSYSGPTVGSDNSPPVLTNDYVTPTSGYSDDTFTYYVRYTDDDGDAPTKQYVYIDGTPHTMTRYYYSGPTPYHGRYKYETQLNVGSHNYYFEFCDGENPDVTTEIKNGPTVHDNLPPSISSHYVTPETGTTNTLFTYKATYSDPENDPVGSRHHVYVDGSDHAMTFINTYSSGGILYHKYEYETTLSVGTHSFYFEFSDDINPPVTTSVVNKPTVTSGNQPPTLENQGYLPYSGDTSTVFTFRVTYTDVDGDAPTVKKIYIDNDGGHTMTYTGGSYSSGANYKYETTLSEGSHVYHYSFNDGHGHSVRSPPSGEAPGPTVSPPNSPPDVYIYAYEKNVTTNSWDFIDGTDQTYYVTGSALKEFNFRAYGPAGHPDTSDDGNIVEHRWIIEGINSIYEWDSGWVDTTQNGGIITSTLYHFNEIQWKCAKFGDYSVTLKARDNDGDEGTGLMMVKFDREWLKPQDYTDNNWIDERKAYDHDPNDLTYAEYKKLDYGKIDDPLVLKYNLSVIIESFNISAKYVDMYNKMEIELYLNDTQQGDTIIFNSWENHGDEVYLLDDDLEINKIKIWFYLPSLRTFSSWPAKVYDFECRTALKT